MSIYRGSIHIDGAVVLIMALDRALRHQDDGGSIYDKQGLLIRNLD
ncbi:hypothetical protein [Desulfosporosinus sp. SB140]